MKKLVTLIFGFCTSLAFAQDVPNHAIPLGRDIIGAGTWRVADPISAALANQRLSVTTRTNRANGWVNVMAPPYNAVGDGSSDDTAAIQAAIDAAYAGNIQTIYLPHPPVCYKITGSLYLDAPGNLRSNLANPSIFAFSLSLMGEPGGGSHEGNFGSHVCPNTNGFVALYVGPGQGMRVSHLSILGKDGLQAAAYRCGRGVDSGIYIAGGGGGASRTLIEDVMIENFYYGISVGLNNGGLGDSNSFRKIYVNNTCIGIYLNSTQNYINDCIECNVTNSGTALNVSNGIGMTVSGGNWSAINGKAVGVMTLSGFSAITATPNGNNFDYSFSATLSAPAYSKVTSYSYGDLVSSAGQVWFCITSPACTGTTPSLAVPSTWEPIANYIGSILNAWTIVTAHYGVIPLTVTSFTQATSAISFRAWSPWSVFYFPQFNAVTNGDLTNEIWAVSTVYAAEWVTTFYGAGINATGVHIENPGQPTQLFRSQTFLNGAAADVFNNIRLNYDPTNPANVGLSGNPAQKAQYYTAQTFPVIAVEGIPMEIHGSAFNATGGQPLLVDINLFSSYTKFFKMDDTNYQYSPMVMRAFNNGTLHSYYFGIGSYGLGTGEFELTPFMYTNQNNNFGCDGAQCRVNWGRSPHWGYRPAPIYHPCIPVASFNTLTGALPAWTNGGLNRIGFGYPFLYGGQIYAVCDWYVGVQSHYLFESTHHFYSMGQNITTTNVPSLSWSYKGQGSWVYADAQTLSIMFAGLGVILNDGSSDIQYVVTGVYPTLGYFTVVRGDNANGGQLSGRKTSVITGKLIKQEAYNLVFP